MKLSYKATIWIFGILSIAFFFVYTSLFINWQSPMESPIMTFRNGLPEILALSQPDIAVNYNFIYNKVLLKNTLYPESWSVFTENQLHPRSTTIIFGQISPIGFPGIIVLISAILKPLILTFGDFSFNIFMVTMTPFIAVITPIFFYSVLKSFFPRRVALLSALLLYVMPIWWYYAAWPAQQHTWQIFLIIQTLYWGIKSSKRKNFEWRYLYSFLAGLFFALAIYIRPVELFWLGPALIAILVLRRKRLSFRYQYLPFFSAAALIAIVFFTTQIQYYGHPFGTGYIIPQDNGLGGSIVDISILDSPIISAILPFGIKPLNILSNTYNYLIKMIFPWAVFSIIGMGLVFKKRKNRKAKRSLYYLYFFLATSLAIIIYYGSSSFFDTPFGDIPTIGTSYTRYFLPIYIFAIPFVARSIISLRLFFARKYRVVIFTIMFVFFSLHGYHVANRGIDGLHMLGDNLDQFYDEREQVLANTPGNSIIITDSADKYLFPYRRVITTASYEIQKSNHAIQQLLDQGVPLYWYNHTPEFSKELDKQVKERFESINIKLSDPIWHGYNMSLREVVKMP